MQNENYFNHFLSGFIGIGIAWIFLIINLNSGSESIISEKIIQILNVESINILTIYSSIIGGCIGGFASITGLSLKRIFIKKLGVNWYNVSGWKKQTLTQRK